MLIIGKTVRHMTEIHGCCLHVSSCMGNVSPYQVSDVLPYLVSDVSPYQVSDVSPYQVSDILSY